MLLSKVWRFPTVNLANLRAPAKSNRFCRPRNEDASKRGYGANKFILMKPYPGGLKLFYSSNRSSIRASSSFASHHTNNSAPNQNSSNNDPPNFSTKKSFLGPSFLVCGSVLASFLIYQLNTEPVKAKEVNQDELAKEYGKFDKRFKTITIDELNQHNSKGNGGIWVSFREGVYDVTDFVDQHPGGEIILIAAGNRLDPFWNIYGNHKTKQVLDLLETFRIANIEPEEISKVEKSDVYDPFADDPVRNPMLTVHTRKPFNAETPSQLIGKDFLTPNEAFFVRNHLPVPDLNESDYRLELTGLGLDRTYEFTLNDLKQLPAHDVICSIQCAGNRREGFKEIGEVKGLPWNQGAIGNAKWTGVYLVDLLKMVNCDLNNEQIKHVIAEGHDFDPASKPYSASVQSEFAFDPSNQVLIAYKMNDQDIPRDHGYPVRFIAPGIVGVRNVKWLAKIELSSEEANSHVQRNDYKAFTPDVTMSNVDFKKGYSIQQLPIQSAICEPENRSKIPIKKVLDNNGKLKLSGYAWSGGGRKVVRVDVSKVDLANPPAGKQVLWRSARLFGEEEYSKKLELDRRLKSGLITADDHRKQCEALPTDQMKQETSKSYSWVLWTIELEIDPNELKKGNKLQFICKAIDSSYNAQPENVDSLFNFRGVLNNAWHRIQIEFV